MAKVNYKKIIYYFIILSPIIDIITSFMLNMGLNITVGIITKLLLLCLAVIYLLFIDDEKKWINYLIIGVLFIFSILNILNNLSVLNAYMFTYLNYLFKFIYHIIMLLFFGKLFKKNPFKLYEIRPAVLITVICYLLALITKTDFSSYASSKLGSSGWYSSANELGNILCIFFPICIYNAFENKDGNNLDKILCVLVGLCMLLIGTKVGLLGFFISIFGYLFVRIIFLKKYKLDNNFIIALIIFIIPLIFINDIPAVKNIKFVYTDSNDIMYTLESGREDYLKEAKSHYNDSNWYSKVIGKSYIVNKLNEENILIVEKDFYDIFFMYGYVGISILIGMYIYVYVTVLRKMYYYYMNNKLLSKKIISLVITISLAILIAFISGHSLLSPSVSTYLTLICGISVNLELKTKKSNNKKILVSKNSSIKINNNKYDVIVNNIDLPIKNKFFVKVIAWLLVKNQGYDYALIYNKDGIFQKEYLLLSHAKNKVELIKKNNEYYLNDKIFNLEEL